jgi:hypothetical protein
MTILVGEIDETQILASCCPTVASDSARSDMKQKLETA